LTLAEGAFAPWQSISSNYYPSMLEQFANSRNIPMDVPYKDLDKDTQKLLKYGEADATFRFTYTQMSGAIRTVDHVFEGIFNNVERRYNETSSDFTRDVMRQYMYELECPTCRGQRLNDSALS